MNLTVANIDYIKAHFDPKLAEALQSIADGLNLTAQQTNANPTGPVGAPPPIQAVSVTAANGMFDIQLMDTGQVYRGVEYFVEYSPTAAFSSPKVIHLGTTRNHSIFLGNSTYYFRAYSQYSTGNPSPTVYWGSQQTPTPVAGGGAISGPVPLSSTGSGTASSNGTEGGSGYGKIPYRSTTGTAPRTTV